MAIIKNKTWRIIIGILVHIGKILTNNKEKRDNN